MQFNDNEFDQNDMQSMAADQPTTSSSSSSNSNTNQTGLVNKKELAEEVFKVLEKKESNGYGDIYDRLKKYTMEHYNIEEIDESFSFNSYPKFDKRDCIVRNIATIFGRLTTAEDVDLMRKMLMGESPDEWMTPQAGHLKVRRQNETIKFCGHYWEPRSFLRALIEKDNVNIQPRVQDHYDKRLCEGKIHCINPYHWGLKEHNAKKRKLPQPSAPAQPMPTPMTSQNIFATQQMPTGITDAQMIPPANYVGHVNPTCLQAEARPSIEPAHGHNSFASPTNRLSAHFNVGAGQANSMGFQDGAGPSTSTAPAYGQLVSTNCRPIQQQQQTFPGGIANDPQLRCQHSRLICYWWCPDCHQQVNPSNNFGNGEGGRQPFMEQRQQQQQPTRDTSHAVVMTPQYPNHQHLQQQQQYFIYDPSSDRYWPASQNHRYMETEFGPDVIIERLVRMLPGIFVKEFILAIQNIRVPVKPFSVDEFYAIYGNAAVSLNLTVRNDVLSTLPEGIQFRVYCHHIDQYENGQVVATLHLAKNGQSKLDLDHKNIIQKHVCHNPGMLTTALVTMEQRPRNMAFFMGAYDIRGLSEAMIEGILEFHKCRFPLRPYSKDPKEPLYGYVTPEGYITPRATTLMLTCVRITDAQIIDLLNMFTPYFIVFQCVNLFKIANSLACKKEETKVVELVNNEEAGGSRPNSGETVNFEGPNSMEIPEEPKRSWLQNANTELKAMRSAKLISFRRGNCGCEQSGASKIQIDDFLNFFFSEWLMTIFLCGIGIVRKSRFVLEPFLRYLPTITMDCKVAASLLCEPILRNVMEQPGRAFHIDVELLDGLGDDSRKLAFNLYHKIKRKFQRANTKVCSLLFITCPKDSQWGKWDLLPEMENGLGERILIRRHDDYESPERMIISYERYFAG